MECRFGVLVDDRRPRARSNLAQQITIHKRIITGVRVTSGDRGWNVEQGTRWQATGRRFVWGMQLGLARSLCWLRVSGRQAGGRIRVGMEDLAMEQKRVMGSMGRYATGALARAPPGQGSWRLWSLDG